MILGLEIRYKGRYEPKSFVGPSSPPTLQKDPQVWSCGQKQSRLCVPMQKLHRGYSRYEHTVADLPWQE